MRLLMTLRKRWIRLKVNIFDNNYSLNNLMISLDGDYGRRRGLRYNRRCRVICRSRSQCENNLRYCGGSCKTRNDCCKRCNGNHNCMAQNECSARMWWWCGLFCISEYKNICQQLLNRIPIKIPHSMLEKAFLMYSRMPWVLINGCCFVCKYLYSPT